MGRNKHLGSTLDSLMNDGGVLEKIAPTAIRRATAIAFLQWLARDKCFVVCAPTSAGNTQLYEPIPFNLAGLAEEWIMAGTSDWWRLDVTRSYIELREPGDGSMWRVPRSSKERVAEIDSTLKALGYRDGLAASTTVDGATARQMLSGMDEKPAGVKVAKRGDFAVGRRWRCTRRNKHSFDFVIVADGSKPETKRCRIEIVDPLLRKKTGTGHGMEQEYSHRHLKRSAKPVGP